MSESVAGFLLTGLCCRFESAVMGEIGRLLDEGWGGFSCSGSLLGEGGGRLISAVVSG